MAARERPSTTSQRRIRRRDFLIGSGALGLAAVAATPASTLGRKRAHRPLRGPTPTAWRALGSSLDGRLLFPGEAGFTANRLPWNLAAADRLPEAVALVDSTFDVQRCVDWARDEGIPAVARCGGHSYAGYSTTSGLLVDLRNLDHISVDGDGVATIGAGSLLGEIDTRLNASGMVLPSGRCAGVGIAGLVLGGGFGFNARKFGLTSDNLIDTELVIADGDLRLVDERSDRDLFWALRGGGGGNFGINVSFRFQTYQTPRVSVYRLAWAPQDAGAAWSAVQKISEAAPHEFSLRLGISIGEDGPLPGATNKGISALGQYLGPVDELRDLLAPAIAAATPASLAMKKRDDIVEVLALSGGTAFLGEAPPPMAFLDKSAYLPQGLSDPLIEALVEWMDEFPSDSREGDFTLFSWGGAINEVPEAETAFAHRTAAFVAEGCASWHPGDPASVVAATKEWQARLFEMLSPGFDGSAYQNFMDPTQVDWQRAYYGNNLERLIEVKSSVDPENFFSFPQSIPTSHED
jgi:FAD/FMN-containing dehydrogenase